MDEELTILTNPDGSGPVVISIGVPTGALKTAAGNPAGNSGAMPIQTGGREGKNYWRYVRYLTSSTLWRI